jgi:glycosyltransferase involved in cell wall biosynthesis
LIADAGPLVDFVGEITDSERNELLGNALAFVFPIEWPEPFGLVMIEAMASGTPVIAWRRGSVPEVVDHGVTGYVVDDVEQAVAAVHRVKELSRAVCRQTFERRFDAARMAGDYVELYRRVLGS